MWKLIGRRLICVIILPFFKKKFISRINIFLRFIAFRVQYNFNEWNLELNHDVNEWDSFKDAFKTDTKTNKSWLTPVLRKIKENLIYKIILTDESYYQIISENIVKTLNPLFRKLNLDLIRGIEAQSSSSKADRRHVPGWGSGTPNAGA